MFLGYHSVVGILAGLMSFFAFVFYYISILKHKTTPNRATWFILTIVGVLITASYYQGGARETIWVPLSYILGPLIAFLLSVKYGEGGWTKFDKFCLVGSGISIIFWWLSGFALFTLLVNIFIDFLGLLPTVKKSYFRPRSEELFPWILTGVSSLLNVLAIKVWEFDIWVYPLYMLLVNGIVLILLSFPTFRKTL